MKRTAWIIAVALFPTVAPGQIHVSGLADVLARNSTEEDVTNRTFRGTSNLDLARLRLFFDASASDRTQFFAQVLFDDSDLFLYSAYARFQEIGGSSINAHLGLIPTTVGTFAARTYSDKNPLVGVPLLYNHHSSLNPKVVQGVSELLAARDERSRGGLPVLYDNCWNAGVEIYGNHGRLDYSVGLLAGSSTLPRRTQSKELPQATARLGWYHGPGLTFGFSGYYGPYLFDGISALEYGEASGVPAPEKQNSNEFMNAGVGYDLYYSTRYVEVHSETVWSMWEHPTLPTLDATAGYLEAKYKVRPGWFVAGRYGFFEPGRVTDDQGTSHRWDYPVRRVEYGIGYRPSLRVTTKLVAQQNRFQGVDALARDHVMLQVSTGF